MFPMFHAVFASQSLAFASVDPQRHNARPARDLSCLLNSARAPWLLHAAHHRLCVCTLMSNICGVQPCTAQRQVSVARLGEPILLTKSSYNSGEDLTAMRLETCGNMAGSPGLCVGIAIQKRRVRTHLGQNSSQ